MVVTFGTQLACLACCQKLSKSGGFKQSAEALATFALEPC